MNDGRRVAIVTGAARGIGKAALVALARSGAIPVAFDRLSEADAADSFDDLRGNETAPEYHCVDVTDGDQIADAVARVAQRHGRIDILVNNAGILSTAPIDELSEDEWRRVIDINLTGAFLCTRTVIPSMKAAGWGRIVNIASMAGRMGGITVSAAYSASKAGMIALTWNVARNMAAHGITANAIAPGPTDGAMFAGFTPDQRQTLERSIPVGRLGTPDEIGDLAAYLCSENAGFINGAVIDANGGAFTG